MMLKRLLEAADKVSALLVRSHWIDTSGASPEIINALYNLNGEVAAAKAKLEHPVPQWEVVLESATRRELLRLEVPGGWLYRMVNERRDIADSLVFVPKPNTWEG